MMKKLVAAAMTAAAFGASDANAGTIDIDIIQQNNSVVFEYGGSFDTTGLSSLTVQVGSGISPTNALISAVDGVTASDFYFGSGFLSPFGDGPDLEGGVLSGDLFTIAPTSIGFGAGYVSGSAFSGSLAFAGESFATLGIDLITDRTFNADNNTIVLNSSIGVSTVPLPPALVLMLSALAGLGFMSRKQAA